MPDIPFDWWLLGALVVAVAVVMELLSRLVNIHGGMRVRRAATKSLQRECRGYKGHHPVSIAGFGKVCTWCGARPGDETW